MNIFLLLTLIIAVYSEVTTAAVCIPKIKLSLCHAGKVNKRYTYHDYPQTLIIRKSECAGTSVKTIRWTIANKETLVKINHLSKFDDKMQLLFGASEYQSGDYILTVKVLETKGSVPAVTMCTIRFICEPPVIIFRYGTVHYIEPGSNYQLDMSKSKYCGVKQPPGKHNKVSVTVTCTKVDTVICRLVPCPVYLGTNYKHNTCHSQINFHVTVTHDDTTVKETHTVIPKDTTTTTEPFPVANVYCHKNCDHADSRLTNPELAVSLSLKCEENCDKFESFTPIWEITSETGNKLDSSKWDVVSQFKILIKKNMLLYDTRYNIFVKFKDHLMCVYVIRTIYKVEQPTCSMKPDSGYSLITRFLIKCVYTGHFKNYPPRIQILQWRDKRAIILKETAYDYQDVGVLGLKDTKRQVLQVHGVDVYGNNFNLDLNPINVEIKPTLDPANVLKQIESYLKEGENVGAIEFMQGLLSEMQNHKIEKKVRIAAEKSVLQDMATLQDSYSPAYRQITHAIGILEETHLTPELRNELSKLCNKMALVQQEQLLNSKYTKLQQQEVESEAEALKHCAKLVLGEQKQAADILTTTKTTAATSTSGLSEIESPIQILKEDYPDYEVEYEKYNIPKVKRLDKEGFGIIDKFKKNIALTFAAGEKTNVNAANSNYSLTAFDAETNVNIPLKGAVIKVTKNIQRKGETLAAVTSDTNVPPTSAALGLVTTAIDLQIYSISKTINPIPTAVEILFDATLTTTYQKYTTQAPSLKSSWVIPDMNYIMNIHRVYLSDNNCTVFLKIEKTSDSLQVVLTKNRRPRLQDFKENAYTVRGSEEMPRIISVPFGVDNSLVYVAVLPHDDMLKSLEENTNTLKFNRISEVIIINSWGKGNTNEDIKVNYEMSIVSTQCLIIDNGKSKWKSSSCISQISSQSNQTKFSCKYKHIDDKHSHIAGQAETVLSKLDVVTTIKFTTVMSHNYIIFIHVAVVFACYCIALCFGVVRKSTLFEQNKLYFLSDNLKNDKYAYLLVVRTGCFNNAGTTSNVSIQIYGHKMKSLPHVLNFPDPEKQMLQRAKTTWFVLTNEVHLGDINKIRIWFDGIGYRPDWYCEFVRILDLQDNKEWYFPVESWFSVLKNTTEVEVAAISSTKANNTLSMTIKKNLRFNLSANNTWNIFSKLEDNNLTYIQRITIILSMIYTTYSIIILMLPTPTLRASDAYGYGEFRFTTEVVTYSICSSIITALINTPFTYIFRNSVVSDNKTALLHVKKLIPSKACKIAWYCLCSWILLCMIYLIIFSIRVPFNSSYVWILYTVVSILLSVFVMESLIIMIINIVQTKFQKPPQIYYNCVDILKEVERQRSILYQKFGEVLMRPYFIKHYRVLTANQINIMKDYELTRFSVASLFRDMIYFLVFILLLYIICMTHSDRLTYYSNFGIKLMVEHGLPDYSHMPLEDIDSVNSYYDYINNSIIPMTHLRNWYANWYTGYEGLLVDCNAKILGVVQLRQQRKYINCTTIEGFQRFTTCSVQSDVFDDWTYYQGSEITNSLGQFSLYSGHGYIALLGRPLKNAHYMLKKLKESKWIDAFTEVLFIEFWTYNANHNVFNMVRIIIERDPSGRIVQSCKVFTAKLVFANRTMQIIYPILLCLLTIIILLITLKHITLAIKHRQNILKKFWEVFDIILITLSITLVCIYIHKDKRLGATMTELTSSNHNEFIMFFEMLTLSQTAVFISAILVCLATVRLWKYFRFGIVFRIIERTIWKSARDLFYTFMLHGFACMMFASFMHVCYGTQFYCFRSFFYAFISMLMISLNLLAEIDFEEDYDVTFKLIYIGFLFVSMIFDGFYVSIIMDNMSDSKEYYSEKRFPYNIKDYIIEESSYMKESFKSHRRKVRLKGGEDDVEGDKVYPKSPTERYDDCLTMSEDKFLLMRLIAMARLRNKYDLEDGREDKFKLMARIVLMLKPRAKYGLQKPDQIFFCDKDPDNGRLTFVPDYRLQQMEFAAKFILRDSHVEAIPNEAVIMHVTGTKRLEKIQEAVDRLQRVISRIKVISK